MEDDGEEEEGSVAADVEEDSLSEGSAISDADDDADAEGSVGDDNELPAREPVKTGSLANGHRDHLEEDGKQLETALTALPLVTKTGDTEAMMNGLRISEVEDEGVAFEKMGEQLEPQPSGDVAQGQATAIAADTVGDRRRLEHEEYKRKRDADPAFVPNRGGFFMHDHRSAAPGQNGFRPFGRGRGRGRGGYGGPYLSSRYVFHATSIQLSPLSLTVK